MTFDPTLRDGGRWKIAHGISLSEKSSDVKDLLATIQARVSPPPVLIVVDTLARNFVGNENATEDMNAYVRACDRLREETGATIFSVHHSGLVETDRGRGSNALKGGVDTEILCSRDANRLTLVCKKQKDAAEFGDMTFETVPVGQSLVLKPMDRTGGKLDGNRLRCLTSLHRLGGVATHAQWKKDVDLGPSSSNFNNARTWLESIGYVARERDKTYAITDAGMQALKAASPSSISSPSAVHPTGVLVSPSRGGVEHPLRDNDLELITTEAA